VYHMEYVIVFTLQHLCEGGSRICLFHALPVYYGYVGVVDERIQIDGCVVQCCPVYLFWAINSSSRLSN
jgi:hypothetical protein